MRALKALYFLFGVVLLGFVLAGIDMAEVAGQVGRVGAGFAVVVAVYFVAFAVDSVGWQLAIRGVPLNAAWAARAFAVRMVGEAFNNVVPAAGFGGEPVKAVLLKRHYGTGYREATASLILAKTVNLLALVAFLAGGFWIMLQSPTMPPAYKTVAAVGMAALCVGVGGFFLVQRLAVASRAGAWLSRRRLGQPLAAVLHHVEDMDDRLIQFYRDARGRFAWALALALANWALGVVEIYVTLVFLGHPITWADAWIVEAVAQLVRTGTFFIPLSLGAQEGAFLLVCGAVTGVPALGVSVAVVRRMREVLWIVAGFALGSALSMRPDGGADGGDGV